MTRETAKVSAEGHPLGFAQHDHSTCMNDALAAAIAGEKSAQAALDEAQAKADRILKPYR